jgi:hypothetical protein
MLSMCFMRVHLALPWGRPIRPSSGERRHGIPAGAGIASGRPGAQLDAIERSYLARLLGRPPTREDAALLPGIDVSDL